MDIRFEASFEKDLRGIRDKKLLNRVKDVIDEVKETEELGTLRNLTKLKGYKTFYRIRLGDYRIGIDISGSTIIFTRILHRKDIYKYFP